MSWLWYWPAGGWDFDKWKSAQKWQPIRSEQSGRADLLPLDGFRSQADKWRGVSNEILGTLTDEPPKKMQWEMLGDELEHHGGGWFSLQRLRYRLTADEWGYAWLLLPRAIARPRGAVIALHQTHPHGKSEPVGFEKIPERGEGMDYAAELAAAGFAVLTPDTIGFGERQSGHSNSKYHSADEFFAAHPEGSVMGKMAYDTCRACDILRALPQTSDLKIGCLGHSHGAYGTLFAMLADQRIEAGVISCGVSLLRKDPTPQRWWRKTALMPRLGLYESNINDAPIDFHHWLALIAPRPMMIVVATQDQIFPNAATLAPALDQVGGVYAQHNAKQKLLTHIFEGPHTFPPDARKKAYEMLTDALRS
jgi:dienelactone hydrolase